MCSIRQRKRAVPGSPFATVIGPWRMLEVISSLVPAVRSPDCVAQCGRALPHTARQLEIGGMLATTDRKGKLPQATAHPCR